MTSAPAFSIRQLGPGEVDLMRATSKLMGEVFDDPASYMAAPPSADYLARLLGGDTFIAVAALQGDEVIGGIAAYELRKFEQERSEIYLYDLAVAADHRRRGVATALIAELGRIARRRGAYVVYVQADLEDAPAIALYSKLGTREDVLHFDIAPGPTESSGSKT